MTEIKTIVQSPAPLAWHALPAENVATALRTGVSTGLIYDEAARRLFEHGENRLPEGARKPARQRFLHQFYAPLIYVLFAEGAIILALHG